MQHGKKKACGRKGLLGVASLVTRGNGGVHFEATGLMPKIGIARD